MQKVILGHNTNTANKAALNQWQYKFEGWKYALNDKLLTIYAKLLCILSKFFQLNQKGENEQLSPEIKKSQQLVLVT